MITNLGLEYEMSVGYAIREKNFRKMWGGSSMYEIYYDKFTAQKHLKDLVAHYLKSRKMKINLEVVEVVLLTTVSQQLLKKEAKILKIMRHNAKK